MITARIIISTTDKWSSTAEDTIIGQKPSISRIRLQDLKESSIDWRSFSIANPESMKRSALKVLRPHQREALDDVIKGFESAERGKLIMACGTGKTFTSLRIAEALLNGKGNVLFLVPSISLLNQSLTEWTAQTKYDFHVYAICSDPKASKVADSIVDTAIPATTDVAKLTLHYKINGTTDGIQMFFSTYQSMPTSLNAKWAFIMRSFSDTYTQLAYSIHKSSPAHSHSSDQKQKKDSVYRKWQGCHPWLSGVCQSCAPSPWHSPCQILLWP